MEAYVLVQTASPSDGIARELRAVDGIVSAENLRGLYAAIAFVDGAASGRSFERVLEEIRNLPSVTRAVAAPLVRSLREATDHQAA